MKARLVTLMGAVFVAGLIIAGCGGSEDSSAEGQPGGVSVETSSLNKDEFIKQASAACERERKNLIYEINEYAQKYEKQGLSGTPFVTKLIKTTLLPTVEAETVAIQELGAPSGDEDEIGAFLEAQQAGIDELKNAKSLKSIEQAESYFFRPGKMLENYGFVSCTY